MPRGNDAAAAAADLIAKGGVTSNAESLIEANQARLTPGYVAVQVRAVDSAATDELDLEQLASDAGLPEDHKVVAAAVRGNAISFVAEDANGRAYKDVYFPNEADAPTEAAAQAAHRESVAAEGDFQAEVAQARAKAEKELADALADIQRETAEQIAKARDEANERIAKAMEEAEQSDEEGSQGNAGDPTPPGDAKQGSGGKRAESSAKKSSGSKKSGSGSKK
jgi:gas vesicle protein